MWVYIGDEEPDECVIAHNAHERADGNCPEWCTGVNIIDISGHHMCPFNSHNNNNPFEEYLHLFAKVNTMRE